MKTRFIFYLLFLLGLFLSCRNNSSITELYIWDKLPVVAQKTYTSQGDSLIICDFSLLNDTIEMGLSSIVSDIEMISLSNEENAIVAEGNITISENYIGIYSSRLGEYKLFDKKGNYLTNISSKGPGPDEFPFSIYDSCIDELSDRIFLFPIMSNKILVYTLNGKACGQIPLPYTVSKAKMYIDSKKKEVLIMVLPFYDIPSVVWMQDFDGNIIQELSNNTHAVEHIDYSNEINSGLNTSNLDFSLFHWIPTPDTLYNYSINENKLKPVFTVKFLDNKIAKHEYIELSDFYLIRIIEDEFDNYSFAMINKKTLTGTFVNFNIDAIAGMKPLSWIDFSRGYYITNTYSYQIKEEIETIITNGSIKPDTVYEQLELLNNNLNEESNNIIIIGKLRKNSFEKESLFEPKVTISFSQKDVAVKSGNFLKERERKEKYSGNEDDKLYGFNDLKELKNTPYKEDWKEYFRVNNKYKNWNKNELKETTVECIVEKDGTTSNVKIQKTSGIDSLDVEAVRLIKEMAGITPATNLYNQKVRSSNFFILVTFPPQ